MRRVIAPVVGVMSLWLMSSVPSAQSPQGPPDGVGRPTVVRPVRYDRGPALRDLPDRPLLERTEGKGAHEPLPIPRRRLAPVADGALQEFLPLPSAPTPSAAFDGIGNLNGVLPPDTIGDVGPNHFVQWVNLSYAIYNKSGQLLKGPLGGNTIFSGFGGPCQTENDGDPVVLYDHVADRWLLTQFALPNFPSGPYYQCIAVSTSGDPTGSYYRYEYPFSKLNDYPKFGVWPDGYYMAINQFKNCNILGCQWGGQGVAAFERDKMLTGQAALMVYFDMAADTALGGMMPTDLDGPAPPDGTPNYFMQVDAPSTLRVWEFIVDWATTANSVFRQVTNLAPATFSELCPGTRDCIPQPDTPERLDALGDRLMYRLQYRNRAGQESFVVNHTVDAGSGRAGVRWYEVRKSGTTFSIFQQGTWAPADSLNRWMASAAMDSAGNIALAYNTANASNYPSIRYTARLAGDQLNQMTQGEQLILAGAGSQTHSASRWGDYSMLTVDPTDGCTFWATLEYMPTTSSAGWKTHIASFKMPTCAGATPTAPAAPSGVTATAPSPTSVNVAWADKSSNEDGFRVERCTGNGCSSSSSNFAQVGQTGANIQAFADATVQASTTYTYRVVAFNGGGSTPSTDAATVTTPAATGPPAAPTNLAATTTTSSVTLSWTDNATNETRVEIQRCTGRGCTPEPLTQVGANATTYTDSGLPRRTTYRYRVRACNDDDCSAYSNTIQAKTK